MRHLQHTRQHSTAQPAGEEQLMQPKTLAARRYFEHASRIDLYRGHSHFLSICQHMHLTACSLLLYESCCAPCSQVPEVDASIQPHRHRLQRLGRVEALQLVGRNNLAQLGMDGASHATRGATASRALWHATLLQLLLLLHWRRHHAAWWGAHHAWLLLHHGHATRLAR
jgi:hypothetical protein